ncbi:UNVERIFIED_CONTAM: hypothetical protein HHA_455700 [Hammondia hammondi]|eukprot:XP_008888889.1 hypothetical protein HHA_455700 [Hammondia hammondi]
MDERRVSTFGENTRKSKNGEQEKREDGSRPSLRQRAPPCALFGSPCAAVCIRVEQTACVAAKQVQVLVEEKAEPSRNNSGDSRVTSPAKKAACASDKRN